MAKVKLYYNVKLNILAEEGTVFLQNRPIEIPAVGTSSYVFWFLDSNWVLIGVL